MIYQRGYKFRIYPNIEQQNKIKQIFGCSRFVYNYFLDYRSKAWKHNKKIITYNDTSKLLTTMKHTSQYCWLKIADSMALQESLHDLDKAFFNLFHRISKYPRFKNKRNHFQSYRTRNQKNSIYIMNKKIKLPKIGFVKIKQSRLIEGKILNATICKTATGKYFVSLCVACEKCNFLGKKSESISIDFKSDAFYQDSNGEYIYAPSKISRLIKKLVLKRKRLKRKRFKSNNRERAYIQVAKIHEKIKNICEDFLHKISTYLVQSNGTILLINLESDVQYQRSIDYLNIANVNLKEFFSMLQYKSAERGVNLIKM